MKDEKIIMWKQEWDGKRKDDIVSYQNLVVSSHAHPTINNFYADILGQIKIMSRT